MGDLNKIGGLGASEINVLFTSVGVRSKTASTKIIDKCIEMLTGYRKEFTTPQIQHGRFNEIEAFEWVVKPLFPNAEHKTTDDSIPIKEGLWASPDVDDSVEEVVIDIKCPSSMDWFHRNVKSPPKSNILQVQTQLLATGYSKGYLLMYLTSRDIDDWGNKKEFDISIDERHVFVPVEAVKDIQDEILKRHDAYMKHRDQLFWALEQAPIVGDLEMFNLYKTHKITELKNKNNIYAWGDYLVINRNKPYVAQPLT